MVLHGTLSMTTSSYFSANSFLCLRGFHEVGHTTCLRRGNCNRMNLRVMIMKVFLIIGVKLQNRSPKREGNLHFLKIFWNCISFVWKGLRTDLQGSVFRFLPAQWACDLGISVCSHSVGRISLGGRLHSGQEGEEGKDITCAFFRWWHTPVEQPSQWLVIQWWG